MTITANLADGRVLNFPDGTDPAVIQATVKRILQQQDAPQSNEDVPTPENLAAPAPGRPSTSIADTIMGGLQSAATMGSSIVAEPIAGLAGIAAAANPFNEEGAGARRVEQVRNQLKIQPTLPGSKAALSRVGEALAPVGEALSATEKSLGDSTLESTGSPALAAIAHTLPAAALEIVGLKGSRHLTATKPPSSKLIRKTLIESAPEVESVKNASRAIFNELDASGVSVNQKALNRLKANLAATAKKEGIDIRVTPEAAGAIDAVNEAINKGGSVPTSEMDTLRTIAKNSIVSTDANKMRVGSAVVDEIDSFLDDIKSVDIDKGAQISAGEVGKKYRAARKLWGRAKRAEMLQTAIEVGSSRKAGMEKGIRNELNNLLNRKKSRKFLSPEDVTAIRKVTDGDFKQNFSSLVGGMGLKFENSPSMFSSIIGGGGLGAVASQVPGLTGAAAPIAIGAITAGTISKEIAKKITKNRAQFLKTIAASGNDAERITKAYLSAVPKAKRKIADLSDLLLDPNLDLTELENVANDTVKDAVKAAQFKRELLQAAATIPTGAALSELSENQEANNER